ncbi:MAG: beta-lactamase family protein [Myxococcales bacterium]|nr:beta-lactamase family protein [Myxococcales bacterium]
MPSLLVLLPLWGCSPSLDQVVQRTVDGGFVGVLHVEHRGEVLVLDAWGDAIRASDEAPAVPNTVDTVFTVGSLTKQFTGAVVLEAQDRGLLSLDDTLEDHFDGVAPERADVTLHQLLTHTGGFPGAIGWDDEVIGREDYLQRAFEGPWDVPVGTHRYSNTGYSLAAAVLEQVTGEPYERLLLDWLVEPLGMAHTGYETPDYSDTVVAHGYRGDEEPFGPPLTARYDSDGPYWHLTGNGGVLSTAADMRRWVAAVHDGEILSDEARATYWSPLESQGPSFWYAYGWAYEEWGPMGHNVNHDGSNGFFFAFVTWWPEDELYVAYYTNDVTTSPEGLAWDLSRAVLR